MRVFGVDPGPMPGLVLLRIEERRLVAVNAVQSTQPVAMEILEALLHNGRCEQPVTLVAVEKFVVGARAGRSANAAAGAATRTVVDEVRQVWEAYDSSTRGRLGGRFFQRSASQVKPWATDERLEVAGLLEVTKGMRHARDAARHALFAAVHDGALPDPLSKEWRSR